MNAVAFSPDGTWVATPLAAARLPIKAARGCSTGRPALKVSRLDHGGPVRAVAFSPDGTRVATGSRRLSFSDGGCARVFDTAAGTEIFRLDHIGGVNAVAFSPDGTRVAAATGGTYQRGVPARGCSTRRLARRYSASTTTAV